jgi:pimeloyl-ACP methyl ester carboxylesterase
MQGDASRRRPLVISTATKEDLMKTALAIGLAMALGVAGLAQAAAPTSGIKNVVLVHGAFADGSGWEAVAKSLLAKGYNVSIVQEPETSFADDVKATQRVLDMQTGPVVLVGHSYGGAIITEAGNDPKVAALVYVAALQPDAGETSGTLLSKMPAAGKGIKQTPDGFLYLDPSLFAADFAADLPKPQAEMMGRSQVFVAASAFNAPITKAAWKTKPSWAIVATEDRSINPDLERFMAKRANSKTAEVKAAHDVYMAQPVAVVKFIDEAAKTPVK